MVTILPIEIDEDLVREGLQLVVAERLRMVAKKLNDMATEMISGGLIEREKWNAALGEAEAAREAYEPSLEYAMAFVDQWPVGEDES
jgi:hypothetical protein